MLGCIPTFSVEDLCNPLQSLQNPILVDEQSYIGPRHDLYSFAHRPI